MSWSFIQSGTAGGNDVASVTPALPIGATAGNLLVAAVALRGNFSTGASAFSFPAGWTVIQSAGAAGFPPAGALAYKVASGGETSIPISWTGTTFRVGSFVAEYSPGGGVPALDVSAQDVGSVGSTVSSVSSGTTASASGAGELDLAVFYIENSQSWINGRAYTNGFSERLDYTLNATNFPRIILADKLSAAAGTQECTASTTDAGTAVYANIAVFKTAAAAGGAPRILTAGSRILGPGAAGGCPRILTGGMRRLGAGA